MLRAKKRKTRKILFRMILFFLLLLFLILGIRSWIEPTVEERLSYQSRVLVTAAINQTVAEELERLGVTYHQMIHLTRDGTGRITALQADTVLLNQIKSAITEQVGRTPAGIIFPQIIHSFGFLDGAENPFGTGTVCFVPAVARVSGHDKPVS